MNEKIDILIDLYKEGDYQGFNYELSNMNQSEKYSFCWFIAENYHNLKSIPRLVNLFNSLMDSIANPVYVDSSD